MTGPGIVTAGNSVDPPRVRPPRAPGPADAPPRTAARRRARRCTADAEPVELLDRSYGEFAVAYAHRSAPSLVVGIRNWSGGEGSGYYTVEYVHIDLKARCPAAAQDPPHAGSPAARTRP